MNRMRKLSKSKIMAYRQCERRLWLEVHRPSLREDSAATLAAFANGYSVGDVARQIYDQDEEGVLIDIDELGFNEAFAATRRHLAGQLPIFEAGFSMPGALAFADVLLPTGTASKPSWRMVEVKSSTSLKAIYQDDAAVQAYIARHSGVPLTGVAVAHIDNTFTYEGKGDYRGLLVEHDLTQEVLERDGEVKAWLEAAHKTVALSEEPATAPGAQCNTPYACGFLGHCNVNLPKPQHPVSVLPRAGAKIADHLETKGITELADVPDALLNPLQQRVKACTLEGQVYFDQDGAATALAPYGRPAYFLDFETVNFPVPIWKGCRPYQQIPFQFSLHILDENDTLMHVPFLDLSGDDPSDSLARALVDACGTCGPIYAYNAKFEAGCIKALAARIPDVAPDLLTISARLVDLLPIARNHFYAPSQEGSWSIKKVLPALAPDLDYAQLTGVQDGGMAVAAYQEAISPQTTPERKAEIHSELTRYCSLDTYAMVRMWQQFTGSQTMTCIANEEQGQ